MTCLSASSVASVTTGHGSIPLLLFVGAAFALAGSLVALIAPTSEMWWGNRNFPRPQWQMSQLNLWMYNDIDGREPSPAGVVAVRVVGCLLFAASVGLTVSGFKQL